MDDEPIVLRMIRRALLGRGFTKVDTALNAPDALALAGRRYDIALVDVRLDTARDGIDLVRELRTAGFIGIVCMLTCDEEPGTILRALVAGADGYLLKRGEDLGRDVEEMISSAEGGRKSATSRNAATLYMFLRSAGLSTESIEALDVFAELGFPDNKLLADRVGRTVAATSKTITRAEEKLGLTNRAQLVRLLTVLSGFGLRERPGAG